MLQAPLPPWSASSSLSSPCSLWSSVLDQDWTPSDGYNCLKVWICGLKIHVVCYVTPCRLVSNIRHPGSTAFTLASVTTRRHRVTFQTTWISVNTNERTSNLLVPRFFLARHSDVRMATDHTWRLRVHNRQTQPVQNVIHKSLVPHTYLKLLLRDTVSC
jgi:hypothetical protein